MDIVSYIPGLAGLTLCVALTGYIRFEKRLLERSDNAALAEALNPPDDSGMVIAADVVASDNGTEAGVSNSLLDSRFAIATDVIAVAIAELNNREIAVLRLMSEGRPNKEIGTRLNLSEAVIKVYVKSVLRKLNVSNRTQAALIFQSYNKNIEVNE